MTTHNHDPEPERYFTIPWVLLVIGVLSALIYLNEKKLDKTELIQHVAMMDHQYTEIQADIRDIRNVLLIPRQPGEK